MIPLANHLWQSTLFAAAIAVLTLVLRKNHARVRHWLWLCASLKFLVPLSLLVGLGAQLGSVFATTPAPQIAATIEQIAQPFPDAPFRVRPATSAPTARWRISEALPLVWATGCGTVLIFWFLRWRRVRAMVRDASPLAMEAPIPVLSSPAMVEPGVFGVFRPVLLLPDGITARLEPAQLRAVLAHELCHARRRDNLAAAIHMLVEAVFWFHPLVWWIGSRLVDERERACDEEVLLLGSEPEVYAEGILGVCKFYLQTPLPCVSGVSGADLRKRIEAIMTNQVLHNLTLSRRLLLAAAGAVAVAGPLLIGIMNAPKSHAQSPAAGGLKFEVASIRPAEPNVRSISFGTTPDGGVNWVNVDLMLMIAFAYNIECGKSCGTFVSGGPGWIQSARFDVRAKGPGAPAGNMSPEEQRAFRDQIRERVQSLLAERFQLVVRRPAKEMPVYHLVVAKSGHKMTPSDKETGGVRGGRGEMIAEAAGLNLLVVNLTGMLGRPVLDRTGLTGRFDFRLKWRPELDGGGKGPGEPGESGGGLDTGAPSIYTALQEQLGLRLEATKAPIETIVIERVEKPSEN